MSSSMPTLSQNPFSTISTALLLAIFNHFCDNEPVHLPLHSTHPRHILNSVCKRWYNIVRSTFSLWDRVHFMAPSAGTVHQPHPILRQFAFCARLSGLSPLTITFDMMYNGWAFSIANSVIAPHAHRIRALNCMIHGNTNIKTFLEIGEGQFGLLESLDICFVNTQDRPISSFPLTDCLQFTALRSAPLLHRATFHLANGLHPIDLHLPWGQMSKLDLGTIAMPPDVFVKILHASTLRLENGCFYVRFTKPMHPRLVISKHPITMHALRTLRLRLLFPSQDIRLFSLLRLPALQGLWVQMYDEYQDWNIPLYTTLLGASTKTLRELQLNDYPPHGSNISGFVVRRRHRKTTHRVLAKFFRVIANIEILRLPVGLDIDMTTANKMALYILLPKLSSLELSSLDGWPILSIARRRHALLLDASSVRDSDFEIGSSDRRSLGPPKSICMTIPRGWSTERKRALVEEAQALGLLGIRCTIQSTDMLPLPVIDQRDIMRSRLLAWVVGIPPEDLF